MKTLYLECNMGAAGDMLASALLELLPNPEHFLLEVNQLGIPGVKIEKKPSIKCGIQGTSLSITIDGEEEHKVINQIYNNNYPHTHQHSQSENHNHTHQHLQSENHNYPHTHHHSNMLEITNIIEKLPLKKQIKEDILSVYQLIAQAESHVHGVPVTHIHFHEVGMMDAVADITMVCMLIHQLAPEQILVSPIHIGSGHIHCAHGILPVPAPATAYILRNIPVYSGNIQSELCTPTGAALLKHFAHKFGEMPIMSISSIGYGMGKKDFISANCVRAFLGETQTEWESISKLSCNIDDMTAEEIGFAMDILSHSGALDVYTIPIGMKKSRPGTLLSILCKESDKEKLISLIFQHTTTLGIRENICKRYTLERSIEEISTPYGNIHRKISSGYGTYKIKYEYDDLTKIAKNKKISLSQAKELALKYEKNV